MKKILQLSIFALALISMKSFGCSVAIMDKFQKNQLISYGAHHFGLVLTEVSKIEISDYARNLEGEDPESLCPLFLHTEAQVTLTHSPSPLKRCTSKVDVKLTQYIWEPNPSIPFIQVNYENKTQTCSLIRPTPIPRPCLPGVSC